MPTPREDRHYTLHRKNAYNYTSKRMELIGAKTIKDSLYIFKNYKPERKEDLIRSCRKTIMNSKEELRDGFELNKDRITYEAEVILRMISLYKL